MQFKSNIFRAFRTTFRKFSRSATIIREIEGVDEVFNIQVMTSNYYKQTDFVEEINIDAYCLVILQDDLDKAQFPDEPAISDRINDRGKKSSITQVQPMEVGDKVVAWKVWVE